MTEIKEAYDQWAKQYDINKNRTRDLEAKAIRKVLSKIPLGKCLELGCGTGKNSIWLKDKSSELIAVDFSKNMLEKAKLKINDPKIAFVRADLLESWTFAKGDFDTLVFSLILEHIEKLDPIFKKAANVMISGGYLYLGELHPCKQYLGSKARFETNHGQQELSCFNHHLSDFTNAGIQNGFRIIEINEFFDDDDKNYPPRILAMLFQKK